MYSILLLVLKLKHDYSFRAKKLTLNFCFPQSNRITGTQHHQKLLLHSSCHVQGVLVVATKLEQGTISVGNKRPLVITGALIASTFTQRAISCHLRWYMCLLHWMIHLSTHLRFSLFVNSHPGIHRTQRQSRKLLQYLVGIQMIRKITCHRHPPRMEVAIFMDAWWMCLSWKRHNDNRMS